MVMVHRDVEQTHTFEQFPQCCLWGNVSSKPLSARMLKLYTKVKFGLIWAADKHFNAIIKQ